LQVTSRIDERLEEIVRCNIRQTYHIAGDWCNRTPGGCIFANAPRLETLSKRRKDCKMPQNRT
jgi:hypothetical protein